MLDVLILAALMLIGDGLAAATPAPSPTPDPSLVEPADNRTCAGSTLALAATYPAEGRAGAQDIVDIRRFYMDSVVGPPMLAGWLYLEKNGDEYFEPNGTMTQAQRSLLVDALQQSDLGASAAPMLHPRGGPVSLQSDDLKAKLGSFFTKHGTLRNCFTRPLQR